MYVPCGVAQDFGKRTKTNELILRTCPGLFPGVDLRLAYTQVAGVTLEELDPYQSTPATLPLD